MQAAVGEYPSVVVASAKGFDAMGHELSDFAKAKARTITKHFMSVCKQQLDLVDALSIACGIAQIDEAEVRQ